MDAKKLFSDSPAEEDQLKRKPFAREITSGILQSFRSGDDSIVIGLNGKWGCGKTTLLNFIQKEIQAQVPESERIIFRFNPWLFTGQEHLQRIFLSQLLENFKSPRENWNKLLKKVYKPIKWLLTITKIIHPGAKEVSQILDNYLDALVKDKPIESLKKEVDEILTKNQLKIFVFIDDLDRLTPTEIGQVFQMIKLNANFKNTFYFVAYDREIVQNALVHQYHESGKKYLEKIIQVDYTVPEILIEVVEKLFFDKLDEFFKENKIEYDANIFFKQWDNNAFKEYFKTLRDIYRYINALQLRLPTFYKEVDISDFLIIEAIRVFDYYSYEKLYIAHKLRLQKSVGVPKILAEDSEFILKTNPASWKLIQVLFAVKREVEFLRNQGELRISNPFYFERYFCLAIPVKDIDDDAFRQFLFQDASRKDLLEELLLANRFDNFLRRILNPDLKKIYGPLDNKELLNDLLGLWDSSVAEPYLQQFAFTLFDALNNLAEAHTSAEEGYKALLESLLIRFSQLPFSRFIFLCLLNDDSDQAKSHINPIFLKIINENEQKIRDRLKEILKEWIHYYLRAPSKANSRFIAHYFITRFARFFPSDYQQALDTLFNKQQFEDLLEIAGYAIIIDSTETQAMEFNDRIFKLLFPSIKNFQELLKFIDSNHEIHLTKRLKLVSDSIKERSDKLIALY